MTILQKKSELFKLFLENENRVVSKEQIVFSIYENETIADASLRSLVRRLREKLPMGEIDTLLMVGYKFYM